MAAPVRDDFKVCVESLHTSRIKEINYEGEEILQERPTVSQRLTELAQRVDFTDSIESEESEPPPKKSTQKWPWESPHSQLKQALTEISVLSDVLQIIQNHRQYVALDPVLSSPLPAPSPVQQYIVKKRSLEKAGDILCRGTIALSKSSTRGEKEFHQTLPLMRKRWRLRRQANGLIAVDLGYHSAGSYMRPVFFEVSKKEEKSAGEAVEITVPRELRGKSEIVVFISDQPVLELPSLSSLTPSLIDMHAHQQKDLPSWELKLREAQNVIFNQELFTMIAKEAYNQKPTLYRKVCSNKINVLLSPNCWLSVLHVREYDGEVPSSTLLPDTLVPRWSLVVALKQLLRQKQRKVSTLNKPHPATVGFSDYVKLSKASVTPATGPQLREITFENGIFRQFLEKVKHIRNEELAQSWLSELCSSCVDPLLSVTWQPDRSLTKTIFSLVLAPPPESTQSGTVIVTLSMDKFHVRQSEGPEHTHYMDKDCFMRILRHQILLHQMELASSVARDHKWVVLQQNERPLFSPPLLRSNEDYSVACSLSLQSPDAHKKLDVLLQWDGVTVTLTHFATNVVSSTEDLSSIAPSTVSRPLSSQPGPNLQQRLHSLFSSLGS